MRPLAWWGPALHPFTPLVPPPPGQMLTLGMATMPRPWQDSGWRSKEPIPRENPPVPHPPQYHPQLQHSRVHPTPHLLLPSLSPVQVGSIPTLNPATAAPGGSPEPHQDLRQQSPGAGTAHPHPRGQPGSCTVVAISWAWAAQQLLGFAWQGARTINT